MTTHLPPALPLDGAEPLTAWARRGVVVGMLGAHLAAGWALLQIESVRLAVGEITPIVVDLIAPPAPPVPPPPPQVLKPLPSKPLIVAAPSPSPTPPIFVAPPPPPEPVAPEPVITLAPPAPPRRRRPRRHRSPRPCRRPRWTTSRRPSSPIRKRRAVAPSRGA